MDQDGVDTDTVTVTNDRYHGPQREGKRRVIAETSLCIQRDRETLQHQLDLVHAHADLNGKCVDAE